MILKSNLFPLKGWKLPWWVFYYMELTSLLGFLTGRFWGLHDGPGLLCFGDKGYIWLLLVKRWTFQHGGWSWKGTLLFGRSVKVLYALWRHRGSQQVLGVWIAAIHCSDSFHVGCSCVQGQFSLPAPSYTNLKGQQARTTLICPNLSNTLESHWNILF